jgi:hypothetical protein
MAGANSLQLDRRAGHKYHHHHALPGRHADLVIQSRHRIRLQRPREKKPSIWLGLEILNVNLQGCFSAEELALLIASAFSITSR